MGDKHQPTEIIVPSDWVEDLYASGKINLTESQIDQISSSESITLPIERMNPFIRNHKRPPITWIEPIFAVHFLAPHLGGDVSAKIAIAERIKDGALECSVLWLSEELDSVELPHRRPKVEKNPLLPGTAFFVSPPRPRARRPVLGGQFSVYSDDWERDVKRWDWASGIFVVSRDRTAHICIRNADGEIVTVKDVRHPRTRMVAFRIQFNKSDVEKIINSPITSPAPRSEERKARGSGRGRSGERRKKFDNSELMKEISEKISSGEFGKCDKYGSQSKIERLILDKYSPDNGPSDSTVRRWATELMRAWREREGSN